MSEQLENPTPGEDSSADGATAPPTPDWGSADVAAGSERPELSVGAAFAGGFVLAMILKRLAR